MLTEIQLENWKSFHNATLYIDPLTVLTGMNASGKSNILDALLFLQRSISSRDIYTAIQGDRDNNGIRGGIENIELWGQQQMPRLSVSIDAEEGITYRYLLYLRIEKDNNGRHNVHTYKESLSEIKDGNNFIIFSTVQSIANGLVKVSVAKPKRNNPEYHEAEDRYAYYWTMPTQETILKQLSQRTEMPERVSKAVKTVADTLQNIFILDPIPANMRQYVSVSPYLAADGANAAGVIANLGNEEKTETEQLLTNYAQKLPEQELHNITVGLVGLGNNDAMFYCDENFVTNTPQRIDARSMSDGTLRFLAILTAILTRPKGSLLVVEEIDNGIHPSRAKLLLQILHTEATRRQLDILVTTHNVAFLNELTEHYLPFVMYVRRNSEKGYSEITPINELDNLPFLLGQGSLGAIVTHQTLI